ncbi:unnamed protein product [marine sediment metagenome]|uniref:Uncharacterized protein n=1 Tax=marine sediment metagenome TaxID=412755 RepID=X0YQG1_9ZZZZ
MARHKCGRSAERRMFAMITGGFWHPKFGEMLEATGFPGKSRKKRGRLKLKKRRLK